MTASRSLCILDTNVLIDMHIGGVLGKIFGLPYEFASPDLILDELETLEASELLHLGLRPLELSGEEVLYVEQLARRHAEVSVRDLFALVAAASRNTVLITGDRRLRMLAETKHSLKVHGTLWLLDEMVKHDLLHPRLAAQALNKMLKAGSRLPPAECAQRFRVWEGK